MNREKTLKALDEATISHEYQMNKVKSLVEGSEIKEPPMVDETKCQLGLWLYDENNHIKEILGAQFFDNLEEAHTRWHREYSRIFDIYYKNRKKGFFSKLIGSDKIEDIEIDKAKLYNYDLIATSENLFKALAASKRRISAMGDSKFNY